MSIVEKARQDVEQRTEELQERTSDLRQLQNRSNRLRSRLSEFEVASRNGDERLKEEVRALTKESLEVEMLVANARFAVEDAQERLAEAKDALDAAMRAVKSDELKALSEQRLELVDDLNNQIDSLEQSLQEFTQVVAAQVKIAEELSLPKSNYTLESGPLSRLMRLVESSSFDSHASGKASTSSTGATEKAKPDEEAPISKHLLEPGRGRGALTTHAVPKWKEVWQSVRRLRVPLLHNSKPSNISFRR